MPTRFLYSSLNININIIMEHYYKGGPIEAKFYFFKQFV